MSDDTIRKPGSNAEQADTPKTIGVRIVQSTVVYKVSTGLRAGDGGGGDGGDGGGGGGIIRVHGHN